MISFRCRLGEVRGYQTEAVATEVAERAACLIGRERVLETGAKIRGTSFVPTVLLNRTEPRAFGGLEAEVIVHSESCQPAGLLFRIRSALGAMSSPVVETWEETLDGCRTGPTQLLVITTRGA